MCGGFTCSKNALIALNILYIVVAFILVGVVAYGRMTSVVTSAAVVGGILACGVFLLLLSILGLLGARKHHQVMLFFYMVVMFMLFIAQFSIACACLAFSREQVAELANRGWEDASADLQNRAQQYFQCCGFNNMTADDTCHVQQCCPTPSNCYCPVCSNKIQEAIESTLQLSGGVGLFFSFTEILAILLTHRFRHLRNPENLNKLRVFFQ